MISPVVARSGTLAHLVRERARDQPDAPAYLFLQDGETEGASLTYAAVDREARAVAALLARAGARGKRVLLLHPPGLDLVTAFLGCLYAGAVAVPAYPPRPGRRDGRLQAIVESARPAFALATSAQLPRLAAEIPGVEPLAGDILIEEEWVETELAPESPAFLQYTSGSTASPKGVIVTHGNLVHNLEMIRRAFGQDRGSVVVGWLPLYHDMGLIGNVLQPLYCGGRCVLMAPTAFLQRPARWLRAVDRYRATTSGGPSFAYELCVRRVSEEERAGLDLSSWEVAFNGAEPVRAGTLDRFAASFAPCGFRRRSFYPCYGLAEATLFVAGGERGSAPSVLEVDAAALEQDRAEPAEEGAPSRALVGCGHAWEGQRVVIAEPESGRPLGEGQVGEVWVCGPSVAAGYWDRPGETALAFGPGPGGERFLRTGDLGFLAGGELFLTGRAKDLIILRGRNLYPQDVELTAERSHPGLRPGAAAAFAVEVDGEERLVVAQEVEREAERRWRREPGSAEAAAEAVRRAVSLEHEAAVHAVVLLRAGSLPKTTSGKVRRSACREDFLAGRLEAVGASLQAPEAGRAPVTPTEELLAGIWSEVFGGERIGVDRSLFDLGADSLRAAQLTARISGVFGVELPLQTLFETATIAGVAEAVDRLQAEPVPRGIGRSPRRESGTRFQLSFAQERLWFLDRLEPGEPAFHIPTLVRLDGLLDAGALVWGLRRIVQRHESLRTRFVAERGGAVQEVLPDLDLPVPLVDLSGLAEEARSAAEAYLVHAESHRPFDLAAPPLLRAVLLRRGPEEHRLILVFHHIVSDGWSMAVLHRELVRLYRARVTGEAPRLPELAVQYPDFADWQRERFRGEALERHLTYWRPQLAGLPPLDLRGDRPRPPRQTFRGGSERFEIPAPVAAGLEATARRDGGSFFMALLAGFAALLHRYSHQEDFAVGSFVANRNRPELEPLIGFFVNDLPLRMDLSGEPDGRALLRRVRDTALAGFTHQEVPFEKLIEELRPERDQSRGLFMQTLVNLLGFPEVRETLPGVELTSSSLHIDRANFDLALWVVDGPGDRHGWLEYNADLFDRSTARRLAGHLRTLLEALAFHPDRGLTDVDLLSEAERDQVLREWNDPRPQVTDGFTPVHQMVAARAEETPEALAVVQEDEDESLSLTYRELEARANRLARHLERLGVEPEGLVGLCTERSPEMVVGLLGILKAGAAYVPLDPTYPRERLELMAADARVPLVVAQRRTAAAVPGVPAVLLDAGEAWWEAPPPLAPSPAPSPPPGEGELHLAVGEGLVPSREGAPLSRPGGGGGRGDGGEGASLAYVIYTSGSTGRPKGVLVPHRGLASYTRAAARRFGIGRGDRVLQLASLSFDASAEEIYPCLASGATLVLRTGEMMGSMGRFVESCAAWGLTVLDLPTAWWHELTLALGPTLRLPDSVRLVILGGEKVLAERWALWRERAGPGVRLVNTYGPTEATIVATWEELEEPRREGAGWREAPIGRPVDRVRAYVLDPRDHLAPAGMPGELVLGGAGVVRGYLGDPALTAARFVPDPYGQEPGARLYRSGDLARFLPDGRLEILGRADSQVKIRGFRVEPGEVEALLAAHPAVTEAAVVARADAPGAVRLVAYAVTREREAPPSSSAPRALRAWLAGSLPDYMLPAAFVVLDSLPRTPAGKVDRRGLPAPDLRASAGEAYVAPRTPSEEIVAAVWQELLGVPSVGADANFFELGGHSLLATTAIARLQEALGVDLPLRAFFEAPTLAELALRVEGAGRAVLPPIVPVPRDRELPLSFAQERLWFLAQLDPASIAYNVPRVVHMTGRFDAEALERAYAALLARHESLRTTFRTIAGRPVQRIPPPGPFTLHRVDLRSVPRRDAELRRLIEEEIRNPFDLERGPMLRAILVRLAEESSTLIQTEHHLVHDGWTQGVLLDELLALYQGFHEGRTVTLPALPVQYADFAHWQRRWLQGETLERELAYWREHLAGIPPVLELPADRPRPPVRGFRGCTHFFHLPPALLRGLEELSRRHRVTLFMTLLAAFDTLLSRYSRREDVVVGSPIANRTHVETENLIGFFVNTLPLRASLAGAPTFVELLPRVREVTLGAYAHQYVPFEKLVEDLAPERDLSYTPLCQVMLILQNARVPELRLPGLVLRHEEVHNGTSKFDILISLQERDGGLSGMLEYATDLFDATTMHRFQEHLERLLGEIVREADRPPADLPLLGEAESHQLLVDWNDARADLPGGSLSGLIAEQVRRTPEAPAVAGAGEVLTYRELERRVDELARRLRRLGVETETRVGVCLERTPGLVVALLAVHRAGGAYVPLDPTHPRERLDLILRDAGVPLLLTQRELVGLFAETPARRVLLEQEDEEGGDLGGLPDPDQLAYVLYTSGSTGRPKGVEVTHGSLANFLLSMRERPGLTAADTLLACTTVAFDIAGLELFLPLIAGARVVLADRETAADGRLLAAALDESGATVMQATPAAWSLLLEADWSPAVDFRGFRGFRGFRALCGGEALPRPLAERLLARGVELWNLYGPTETTIWSAACRVEPGSGPVPVGGAVANTDIYILDPASRPAGLGIPGELLLGGAGLARGYLGRPDLTAERFVPDPVGGRCGRPGARLYRTGDLARWRPDGGIELLGRLDHQVKLRGFRIELGEIEAVLASHPAVAECAAVLREDRIIAYVTVTGERQDGTEAVSRWSQVWDEAYREAGDDLAFDISGWNSSYTGEPLGPEQMGEWLQGTVERILALRPQRVLEIGCGTGMILHRIAPHCRSYLATDISPRVVERLRRQTEAPGSRLSHVTVMKAAADRLDFDGRFDVIILNSVVQYFPGVDYLLAVVDGLMPRVAPGGAVFLGDIRSLPLLPAFRLGVELVQAPDDLPLAELRRRVAEQVEREPELLLDPRFFHALARRYQTISGVDLRLKRGRHLNELTKFRYDVVLRVGGGAPMSGAEVDWEEGLTLDGLRRRLESGGGHLSVRRIPNARLREDLAALRLMAEDAVATAGALRVAARRMAGGIDPEDLHTLATELSSVVSVTWSRDELDLCDAVFRLPHEEEPPPLAVPVEPWSRYANVPRAVLPGQRLAPQLSGYLRERLPSYMVPATFVFLDALPLNPSGKVDRRALPAPGRGRDTDAVYVTPRDPVEEKLAGIWSEVLGVDRVGVHDLFFSLGGHSLIATRLMSRVRQRFGADLPLRVLFERPTVAGLAARIAEALGAGRRVVNLAIRPARQENPPLSFAQERLWFLDQLAPGSPFYNLPGAFHVRGGLSVPVLERTFAEIVRRHEVLRTAFPDAGGHPVQRIVAEWAPVLPVVDLGGIAAPSRDRELERLLREEAQRPFDLARGPLLRVMVLRTGGDRQTVAVTMHHIVSDGWSMGVLMREVTALYGAFARGGGSPLPALAIQYADFAAWQREWLQGEELERQLAYWRHQLAGAPGLLDLPADRPRPAVQGFRGGRLPLVIPPALLARLEDLGRRRGVTLFMTLLGTLAALLQRHGAGDDLEDLVVGSPVANRNRPEIEDLIGFFVNTLVLRLDLAGGPSFRDLLGRVREVTLEAQAHQDLPFERLVEEVRPSRSLSHTPLLQVVLALQNAPASRLEAPGLEIEALDLDSGTAKFDLSLSLEPRDGALRGYLEYGTDLFDGTTAARLVDRFKRLLEGAVAAPDSRVSDLPLLGEAERHQLQFEWGAGEAATAPEGGLVERLDAATERRPEAPALVFQEEVWTFRELRERVRNVACHLAAAGVRPGDVVGLCCDRSLELAAGLIGILEAGAVFLPLDPAQPMERLVFQVRDAGAVAVLADGWPRAEALGLRGGWRRPDGGGDGEDRGHGLGRLYLLRRDGGVETPQSAHHERTGSTDVGASPGFSTTYPAYLIYTSGTTGMPKAVLVEHRSLLHTLDTAAGAFGFGPGERMPSIASFAFDIFLFELLAALLSGGTVELLPLRPALDPGEVAAALGRSTRFHAVPAVLRQVLERLREDEPARLAAAAGLREVYVGGDVVPDGLLDELRRLLPSTRVRLLYGPTEATIFCTSYGGGEAPLLGRPLAGVRVRLCGPAGREVPMGVPGEIWLGGAGVARGYLGRPDLTAERFVPDMGGARLYRTGDLARWRPDGNLEFLGRTDSQVKVRGVRVEPGEIEALLARHPAVREAAVVAREVDGDRRLAAFVVLRDPAEKVTDGLREELRRRLPDAMVPSSITVLEALPLTRNAKIDRRALAALAPASRATHQSPRTPVEEILAALWSELLGIDRVGANDGFFDLGGHSLLATRLVSRVRRALGVELPLRAVFEAPTLAGLARRVEAAVGEEKGRSARPPLRPAPCEERRDAPLSFAQQRLWFLDRLEPGSPLYNVPAFLRLTGPLAAAPLARALAEVQRRHEVLRAVFPEAGGLPRQRLVDSAEPALLAAVDLAGLPRLVREAEALRLLRAEALRPFDLAAGPLLRARLLRLGEGDGGPEHLLAVVLHHIVSDGWSMGVLVGEIEALYPAFAAGCPSPLPEPALQYADFALWQRRWLDGDLLEEQLGYWRRRLAGAGAALELPADRPRPAVRSTRGHGVPLALPDGLAAAVQWLGREEGATPFMILLAAFAALLHRLSGQDDLTVGTPVAGRRELETEGLIGFFVNTLVMRSELAPDATFRDHLARVRETALGAWAHQDLPFEKLVEELEPARDPSRTPLFQAMFALQEPTRPLDSLAHAGLRAEPLSLPPETAKVDLTLTLTPAAGGYAGWIEHAADLFDRTTMLRFADRFGLLLQAALEEPGSPVAGLPSMSAAESHQVTVEWADNTAPFPRGRTIPELFAEQAAAHPDRPALEIDGERLTYGEVARRAGALAGRLRRLGVGPEVPVAVFLPRSAELVTALLAILEAGGFYVPLDLEYPPERLGFMLGDCGARVLVTGPRHPGPPLPPPLAPSPGERGERISVVEVGSGEEEQAGVGVAPDPDGLAYLIYTSGSTGQPKGVAVPHRAVVRLVAGADFAQIGPGERVAQASNVSFDAATWEIWGALLNGGTVIGLSREETLSPGRLAAALRERRIDALFLTTALFDQVAAEAPDAFAGLRHLLFGGEAVTPERVRRVLDAGAPSRLLHVYGPTENTTFSTWYRVTEVPAGAATVPIGGPVADTSVHLLDRSLRPVPMGAAGEVCLGGDGLARGYFGRPERTAEVFVPAPSGAPGSRLYRTGDLARMRPDGAVEFLRRLDDQVKVRGFRIEPGEIEAALTGHPAVRQAAVLAREMGPGDRRLVAFLVPGPGLRPDVAALRAFLRERMPDFMVPAAWAWLDALPLTPNGKVDRRALERLETSPHADAGPAEAPRTWVEEQLAAIWRELLETGPVGIHDDFFALGGHSLLATRVASRVREALGIELPLKELFSHPTVAALAPVVEEIRRRGEGLAAPPVEPVSRDGNLPLSFAQEWMWVVDQLDPASAAYNAPLPLHLRGPVDPALLSGALGALAERHESLRTAFLLGPSGPVQVPRLAVPGFPLALVDLSALPVDARDSEALRGAAEACRRPFDLAAGAPMRACLFRLDGVTHALLLDFHHLVTDGWSSGIVLRELARLYEALRTGVSAALPALPVQYADYAAWQRRWISGEVLERLLDWWKGRLAGAPPLLELPVDHPRTPTVEPWGERLPFNLERGLSDGLAALARRRGTTLFTVLLAAWKTLIHRYTQANDLVVGTPVAGRTRREVEGLVGYFVNNLALRTDLGGDPPFLDLLGRVHETALEAQAHQDLPLLLLVRELHPERGRSAAMPLFQTWFQLLNTPLPRVELPDLEMATFPLEWRSASFELELLARETPSGLTGHLVYQTSLYRRETVETLLRHFIALLEGVAASPELRLAELPLLSEAERRCLLVEWSRLPDDVGGEVVSLHRAFSAVAAARPGAPAVRCEGEELTYGELSRRARKLAHRLRRLGVGPESRVGLAAERSAGLIVAILGILEAGAAYVPLDPGYPRERLELLLEDARLDALVTWEGLSGCLPEPLPAGLPVVGLDHDEEMDGEDGPLPDVADPDSLAYVIYTSGSTGRPKGVMVTHRQAARLFAATRRFGFGPEDVWTLFHSYAFDFSVWEIWGALLHGGLLVVVPQWVSRSPEAFHELLARDGVTVLSQTPSAFYALMAADEAAPAAQREALRLRWVVFGGEALDPRKLRPWMERYGDRRPVLVNMYGITETTVHVTLRELSRADVEDTPGSPIGRALPDLRLYVLDRGQRPVPPGAVGEICVGGAGVARGYLGRPGLTAERFVPDPIGDMGGRLYRSGDLARWRRDGELEYLGRADQQVKVRGFRIEPGEIEAALLRLPGVREAVVLAREASPGDVRLAAFVVPSDAAGPSPAELRTGLAASLPEHMVPSTFQVLPALPLTAHGKVDRRVLLDLRTVEETAHPDAAGPATPLEEVLATLWAGLLEVGHVGREQTFFELGGHSLLMTQVASRVREALGVTLPMRSFFEAPTVAGLARTLLDLLAGRLEPGRVEELLVGVEEMSAAEVEAAVVRERATLGEYLGSGAAARESSPPGPLSHLPPTQTPGEGETSIGSLLFSPSPGGGKGGRGERGPGGEGSTGRPSRLADLRATITAGDDRPVQVETVGVPTCNRPEVLARGLESHAEAARRHGRAVRFVVMDDSADPAVRREYRQLLADLRRRHGLDVRYAGREEKERFAADLAAAAGLPPAIVRLALFDTEGVGLSAGANRNALLLDTVGEALLSVDDDTLCRVGPPPGAAEGVAFRTGTDPGTAFVSGRDPGEIRAFSSRSEALAAVDLEPGDLPGLHERLLGRDLRSWLDGQPGAAPADLAELNGGGPRFLQRLAAGGRVRVTTNGWAGDCGWHSPVFYLLLTGDSWERLVESEDSYRTGTASKEIVRSVPRPTVGDGDSFMATLFTGLDNREILPPFPPVLWGEDLLFGIILHLCVPGALVGHLPWVAAHEPVEARRFWPGEMLRGASGIDHSRLVAACLDGFEAEAGGDATARLRSLGAWLEELGSLEAGAFDELARRRVVARAEAFAAELERRLAERAGAAAPGAALWAEDARRYLDLLRRHAAGETFAVPLDLLYGRGVEEARRLAQRLLRSYGAILSVWPGLMAAARGLRERGRRLSGEAG